MDMYIGVDNQSIEVNMESYDLTSNGGRYSNIASEDPC